MCEFNEAWVGKCKKNNVKGESFCMEHLNKKCAICGKQATHDCAETMQFVCGTLLCDDKKCKLQHFYNTHGYAFSEIETLEEISNIKPFEILISKIDYGNDSKYNLWRNDKYKDRIEIILITFSKKNNIKLYKSNFKFYFNKIEDAISALKDCFEYHGIKEKNLYISDTNIKISDIYDLSLFDKINKVNLL